MMSDDWAKRTFDKVVASAEEQRRNEELELNRAGRIAGHAPRLFEFLVKAIQQKALTLNNYFRQNTPQYADNSRHFLEVKVKSNLEAEVHKEAPPPAKLILRFEPSLPAIKYSITKYTGHNDSGATVMGGYTFIISNEEVCIRTEGVNIPVRLEDEAERLLSELVQ